jgi:hypothetical protein
MLKLYQPTEGTTNALQTWIGRANRNNGMDANRSDQFRDTSAAKNILADREDLVSLHPPGDNDLGTTIVALFFGKVLPLLRVRPPSSIILISVSKKKKKKKKTNK